jgi:hypothetical protein
MFLLMSSLASLFFLGIYLGRLSVSTSPGPIVEALVAIANVLLVVVQAGFLVFEKLQDWSPPAYFAWQRFRARFLSRRTAAWEIQVHFIAPGSVDVVKRLHDALTDRYGLQRLWIPISTENSRVIYIQNLLTVEIGAQPDDRQAHSDVSIRIFGLRVGYSEAEERLREDVIPLLSSLREVAAPDAEDYVLNVQFEGRDNPFLGLYLKWAKPDQLADFRVTLLISDEQEGPKNRVEVTRTGITVTARSLPSLQIRALDFLALGSNLGRLFGQTT